MLLQFLCQRKQWVRNPRSRGGHKQRDVDPWARADNHGFTQVDFFNRARHVTATDVVCVNSLPILVVFFWTTLQSMPPETEQTNPMKRWKGVWKGKWKNKWSVKSECDQKSNGRVRKKHLVVFVHDSFVACSIASIGPLSGVTQACWTELSKHQSSRPITVIITLDQWLMTRKLGRFDVAYIHLWRMGCNGSYSARTCGIDIQYSVNRYSLFVFLNVKKVWKECYAMVDISQK